MNDFMQWFGWACAALLAAFVVIFLVAWLWDRREKRRGAVFDVVMEAISFGFPIEFFQAVGLAKAYVIGNYLGPGSLSQKAWQFAQVMRDKKKLMEVCGKLFWNLLAVAKEDGEMRKKVLEFLNAVPKPEPPATEAASTPAAKPAVPPAA